MPLLKSINISNFRSIRGQITVPLDAPIVLIHGQNGAGKTSILSAIELGLTGSVLSLSRGDLSYSAHLPHKSGDHSRIALTVEALGGESNTSELSVTSRGVQGSHLLGEKLSRFFTERCYLAQSTLGRLLEIYQHQDTRNSDSALTRFVKDLLGLDRLDALIDGLHASGDVRRLRLSAPSYWAAREDIPKIESDLKIIKAEQKELETSTATLKDQIWQIIKTLNPSILSIPTTPEIAFELVEGDQEESRLQLIARARRDLQASNSQWKTLVENAQPLERALIETKEAETRLALDHWRLHTGLALEAIHQELKLIFPDLPSPSVADPEFARSVAFGAVNTELQRCKDLLARNEVDESRVIGINRIIEQGKARATILDDQIAKGAGLTEGLAQALAQIAPHVHADDCPVCGRNYGEVSSVSLQSHISNRIASLTMQAGRLQETARDKAKTAGIITMAERELAEVVTRILAPELRDVLKTRRARFEELKTELQDLEVAAKEGAELKYRASINSGQLSNFRSRNERSSSLRFAVGEIARSLEQPGPATAEPIESVFERLFQYIEAQETLNLDRQRARREAISHIEKWQTVQKRLLEIANLIEEKKISLKGVRTAKAEADRRLETARDLGRRAREARTAIVCRVFNEELNKLWRDLFIRLAPEEPFVPAFALPDTSNGSVVAILETLYRAGGKGGNPRSMLSAGNLNTAALTLFLSLHLSVKPSLPWLIIDDPVQSMDEVHISQFAALLRMLAKQQGRQIVIAVHERPLFEYLALELSPAFPNDRLITIELGKSADGTTTLAYEPRIFEADRAIAT